MWVFYVNRGQGVASFGIQDKDHAIMEFMPADKSYQHVNINGFRTFIKVIENNHITFLEAFSPQNKDSEHITEKMTISENMLKLEFIHRELGIKLKIEYFTLPESAVAGLVRNVTFTNLSDKTRKIELLDGLPAIFPSGVPNSTYKELGNTIKSWFDVENLQENIPFYRLRGSLEDSSEVREIHEGNFYVSFSRIGDEEKSITPIVDKDIVFGSDTSLQVPQAFIQTPLKELVEKPQQTTNKVSGGFSPAIFELPPNSDFTLYTIIGYGKNLETVRSYVKDTFSIPMLEKKKAVAKVITNEITDKVKTCSGQPLFDAYTKQSFLDNGLRGGFPMVFEKENDSKVYYLFSRKHGDLERDYNFFSISPTYYSQGNGNYRDINQNRRCDVFIEPKVGDYNVRLFMNLIQLDGYNPLAVKGVRFSLPTDFSLANYIDTGEDKLTKFFQKSFTPGELMHFIENENISLTSSFESFLTDVLLKSDETQQAEFGEGYWMDHWTYNLDLVDSYLAIYPDKQSDFYFGRSYRFFESPVRVKSRKEKYVLSNGKLRQYHAVEKIKEKVSRTSSEGGLWIKANFGEGEIYETNLYSKLFLLALVKSTTVAPYGLGIEMEGDKPGWNDSLNGLPGMFGASTSELFELKRLVALLQKVNDSNGELKLPVEADDFLKSVASELTTFQAATDEEELSYWERITTLRESYRDVIYKGISGEEVVYSVEEAQKFLQLMQQRVDKAVENVQSWSESLVTTYFYFEPKGDVAKIAIGETVIDWEPKAVTPFLEGVVKQLKVTKDKEVAKKLYAQVKDSAIYDEELKMYKTSMSIKDEPLELGRAKSFTPGWLENESIFLHMEYKYLLATLKAGLTHEFFNDMKSALIPFLDAKRYGRSTLENSSFIASSANPNKELHGRGFVSRLSGSTIEFMNMWFVMMAGETPFRLREGQLVCQLSPTLPTWMFDENGEVSFTFLGKTEVTYVNSEKRNTYDGDGVAPVSVELTYFNGEKKEMAANELVGDVALAIRNGEMEKIVVTLSCP